MVNPLPSLATSWGPSAPSEMMVLLKSSTVLPNSILRTTNAVRPTKKPKKPIQAEKRWTAGFSIIAATFPPSLCRREIKVNVIWKRMEKPKAIAMNAGELGGGGERVSCRAVFEVEFKERTERSYTGESDAPVQFTSAALFGREQEPSAPRNILGPSTLDAFSCVKAGDGETVSNETRSFSISTGARKAKSDNRMAVRERIGAK